ncbi:MAG: hypothetical protein ACKV0T_12990, partial [Planctomycetales bacterium]
RIHESKIDMVREQLPATIRVDALPGETFHGVVNMVSLVPMSGNWPNINLKEYVTFIKIEDETSKVSSLKPGLTAEVEILIDRIASTLQAPITGFVERGGRQFAWVLVDNRPVRREVKIGKSNESTTQVLEDESLYGKGEGLKEGDKVVLNPRTTLPKEITLLEDEIPALADTASQFKPGDLPATKDAAKPQGGPKASAGGAPGATAAGAPGGAPGAPGGGGPGAGGGGRGNFDPAAVFASMDKNNDGKITADEIPEDRKQFISMERLDTNKNNAIEKEEWTKAMEAMRARFGGGGGGGGPPGGGRGAGAGAPGAGG